MSLLETLETISGDFVKVERDGVLVGFCEYDWVKDVNDLLRADRGEPPQGGAVLYVSNLRATRPGVLWELKRKLPKARWVVGLDENWGLHAPRGVPHDFLA